MEENLQSAGMTCVNKTPVEGKECTRGITDLIKLKDACGALAKEGKKPMFVIYPKEAGAAASNCWLCDSTDLRKSEMNQAFVYNSVSATPAPAPSGAAKPA